MAEKMESGWINSLLGNADAGSVPLIKSCGRYCAERNGHLKGAEGMKNEARKCSTAGERARFLSSLGLDASAENDCVVLRFHKSGCTCPMYPNVNVPDLCHCTEGHEEALWGEVFGVRTEAEIVESFLRGGKDCIVRLRFGE